MFGSSDRGSRRVDDRDHSGVPGDPIYPGHLDRPGHPEHLDRPPHLEPISDRPPSAPRELPSGATGSAGQPIQLLVGGIFVVIASIFILIGLGIVISGELSGIFFVLFPMIHFAVGSFLLSRTLRVRSKRRDVFANGLAAVARIEETGLDPSMKINRRSPYRIGYDFEVDGRTYTGECSTLNPRITRYRLGDRMWVLYDPEDPDRNVEWPPL